MATTQIVLPVPASNGVGASVDTHLLDAQKSFVLDGTVGEGEILVVEATEDSTGVQGFTGVFSWSSSNPGDVTLNLVAAFMRIKRVFAVAGKVPTASVSATSSGVNSYFTVAIPTLAPGTAGAGAATDVSAGGQEASVSIHEGAGFGPSEIVTLQGSNDNVSWNGITSFNAKAPPGNLALSFKFLRFFRANASASVMAGFVGTSTSGAGGGAFPGFGGAPPQIAVAGAAGGTGLAADAGHTHAGTASVNGATGAATLASAGATVAITGVAPNLNLEVATPFGGFGGPPPNVATASATGVAATGTHSDHTHGLDLVNYTPSTAAMQGTGLVTQTIFAAGLATMGLTAIPTSFPGFGGAPPAVASASAAGAAGTASRSDHTHALDLVAYNPSLAGMQASGVVQQTYGAPTATPSTLTMTATNVPFGAAASGLLTQSTGLQYVDTAATRNLTVNYDPTAAAPARFDLFRVNASVAQTGTTTAGFGVYWQGVQGMRIVGTNIAAATAQNLQILFRNDLNPGVTSSTFTVSSQTVVGGLNGGLVYDILNADCRVGTNTPIIVAANTHGFFWMGANYGALTPSGVPASTAGTVGTGGGIPFAPGEGNQRVWAYMNAAWHFDTMTDYDPTATRVPFGGATAHTLVDSAALTFTTASGTLNVNNVASFAGTGLSLAATGAQALTLSTNAVVRVSASGAGDVTVKGSGGAAPGGTFGDMLWTRATSTLSFGAAGAPPAVGAVFVNTSTGSGISIGGGVTAGILVRDAGAGGEANIAVDTGFLGQRLIGWQSGALTSLEVGVATGQTLSLTYLSSRSGAGTAALTVDGVTGATATGLAASATFKVGVAAFEAIRVVPNAAGSDVFLGYSGIAAAATVGFPYIPSLAAFPSGAPNVFGGVGAALTYTRANEGSLMVRDVVNATWQQLPTFNVTLAGGAGVWLTANLPAGFGTTAKYWNFHTAAGVNVVVPYFTNP